MNLDKLIAEQAPFLQTYAGSDYFDNATANYIQQEKLQRGTWRVIGKKIQKRSLLIEIHTFPLFFIDRQLWRYSDTNMTLENKMDTWMYGNKTWTMPSEDGEGYIVDIENNLSVLGLSDGKSIKLEAILEQLQVRRLGFSIQH